MVYAQGFVIYVTSPVKSLLDLFSLWGAKESCPQLFSEHFFCQSCSLLIYAKEDKKWYNLQMCRTSFNIMLTLKCTHMTNCITMITCFKLRGGGSVTRSERESLAHDKDQEFLANISFIMGCIYVSLWLQGWFLWWLSIEFTIVLHNSVTQDIHQKTSLFLWMKCYLRETPLG